MRTLLAPTPSAKATTLRIKGLAYSVTRIDPGEEGTAAFRLDKLVGDGVYDVIRTHDGLVKCDCPSYVMTFEGTAGMCKHGRALVEAGYLDRPSPIANQAPASSKPAPRPITRADQAAARTWGLKLPANAPRAIEASVAKPVDAPIVEPPAVEVPAPANPRDSWPAWTDEGFWTITPEPASDIDLSGFAPIAPAKVEAFDDHARGAAVALMITRTAIEAGNDAPYFLLDRDSRESFWGFVRSLGWPVATWDGWLELCRFGSPVSFPEPIVVKPTRKGPFAPSAEDMAEALGYELGLDGENASPDRGRTPREWAAFEAGYGAGRAAMEFEFNQWFASVEAQRELEGEAFGSRADRWHFAELAEAGTASGHPAFEG
jgi:hypothetical protein